MSDPYRSTCSKCTELIEKIEKQNVDFIFLKNENSHLKKNKMKDNFGRIMLIVFCLCMTALLSSWVFGVAKAPSEPEKCIESIEIINTQSVRRTCNFGAKMTVEKLSNDSHPNVMMRCICQPSETVKVETNEK